MTGMPLIVLSSLLFVGLIGVVGYLAWRNRGDS